MGTKVINEKTGAKVRRSRKVVSDTINVSGINVAAPETGVNSNTPINNIGVSSVVDPRSLSVSSGMGVSSDRINKVSGHNNATSQLDALITIEETEEKAKEERLYNKVVSHFLAPVFDTDKRKADLLTGHVLAGGSISPAIIAKVDDMVCEEKKVFEKNNPAPLCTPALVLDLIKKDYASEFASVVGCPVSEIALTDVKTYSRSLGVLVSVSIPADATAQMIVRSVLSYKYLLLDRQAKAKERANNNAHYYDGMRLAVRSGIELGRTDEQIINDVKYYISLIRENDSKELCKLRTNYYKIREKIDNLSRALYAACPALVDAWGDSYIVHLDRVKSVSIPAKVKTDLLCKYRGAVKDLTRINMALWGVTSL